MYVHEKTSLKKINLFPEASHAGTIEDYKIFKTIIIEFEEKRYIF